MEYSTETEISRYDQMKYYPLNKLRIEMLRMADWLRSEGHTLLEEYRYESPQSAHTVIGVRSRK